MKKTIGIAVSAAAALVVIIAVYEPRIARARQLSDARARWSACGIHDYTWDLEGGGFLVGGASVRSEVRGDRVAREWSGAPLSDQIRRAYPRTVPELFDRIEGATGSAHFVATYDPTCGYPTAVVADPSRNSTDDEFTFTVVDLEPAA
jgi:hypothetical protein